MIGILTINLEQDLETASSDNFSLKVELYKGLEDNEYNISVQTSLDEDLLSIITSRDKTDKMLEQYKFLFDDLNISSHVSEKIASNLLYDDIQEVVIFGEPEKVKEYIEKNPILKSKTICLGDVISLNRDNLEYLKYVFGDNQNIKVKIDGNSNGVTLDVYEKTNDAIDEIVRKIRSYNYSPYEAMIHTYDLVRDKFYNMEDENESYTLSRDLSNALLGDKIVCLGFSNILKTVFKKLGFKSIVFSLSLPNDEPGHARVLTYIKDEKYEIDGLYFFDPTFDCKKDETNEFLLSYRYFGKSKEEIDRLSGYNFTYETYDLFSFDEVGELEDNLENEQLTIEDLIRKVKVSRVNRILRLLGKKTLEINKKTYNREEIMDVVCEIADLANKPIDAQTFLKALYRVRRNEYYENPTKYVFDMNALTDILVNSKFASPQQSSENNLLAALFGVRKAISTPEASNTVSEYLSSNSLDLDLERVKLTRLLKTISDNKPMKKSK